MRYRTLAGAALTALPLLSASSAQATPCPAIPPGSYTSATVCSVGPLTFENLSSSLTISQGNANSDTVTANDSVGSTSVTQGNGNDDMVTVTGSVGSIAITQGNGQNDLVEVLGGGSGNISPFTSGNEFGLSFP